MFLNSDLDVDSSRPEGTPSRAWAIGVGISMLPVYLAFFLFGMVGKGTAAACAVGTLILAVRMHLGYIRRYWFWCVIGLVAVADAILVAYIPFPNRNYTFPLVAPFGYLEYLLISFCIRVAEKRVATS